MRSNYLKAAQRAQVSHKAMGDYLIRASVDKQIDERIRAEQDKRMKELGAFAKAIDANWLYTLHVDPTTRFGAKRLRRVWETIRIDDKTGGGKLLRVGLPFEQISMFEEDLNERDS